MRRPVSTPAQLLTHCLAAVFLFTAFTQFIPAQELKLQPGDRIAVIGNTLADRMQHDGWLEAGLHYHLPGHKLVFRDLGFSGDSLTERPRSDNFGSPDQWLGKVKADVIIACFGYNESWGGEAGIQQFRQQLNAFITHTLAQKYNGRSAPRLVLCSPTFFENLRLPYLPTGETQNRNIELYTAALRDVAATAGLSFVDLFKSTRDAATVVNFDASPARNLDGLVRDRFGKDLPDKPTDGTVVIPALTINGVHLTEFGNEIVASSIINTVFVPNAPKPDQKRLEAIRKAVLAKNLIWHNVYRATDGYSVFGGRSGLQFVDGQTNFVVMQRELEILEVMASNRDAVIHAEANGQTTTPDDSNLPKPLEVKTNKPGALDGGRHLFLGGKDAIEKMTVHSGMEVNLFASEEMFSDLVNPVQSAVDADGRLWVAAWPTYPHWNPLEAMNDKLLIFPDDNADGVADRCITFADGLHNPTGFEFWNGGVLVAMAPDIFFFKDVDGDDRADIRQRIFHGLDSADTHHTANAFTMSPGGKFYFSRGIFHAETFETPWGPAKRFGTGGTGVYEWDPVTFDINFHFPIGPNPHGDVFDQWGNQFATDGTGGTGNHIGIPGRGAPRQLYDKRVRPVPAICILDGSRFPAANRGNLLIANVIGFQGVTQYQFEKQGASFFAKEVEPIVYSSDPNFRPSDMEIGGDGALYILDWQNPIIGHMQHNLRDPSRDHLHGRIYRVTTKDTPQTSGVKLAKADTRAVVRTLASDTLSERSRARSEITARPPAETLAALREWTATLDPAKASDARSLVEALWVTQQLRKVDEKLLLSLLNSPAADARAAAVRVIRDLARDVAVRTADERATAATPRPADAIPVVLDEQRNAAATARWEEQLVRLAADPDPQVRADAVVAATFTRGPLAAEVLFAAMQTEQDQQLSFVIEQARGVLNPDQVIRETLAAGRKLSRNAEAFALSSAAVDDLLKMDRTEGVYRAILTRENVPAEVLQTSLTGLAKLRGVPETEELFSLIEDLNARASVNVLNSLSRLLAAQPADQLVRVRDRIARLAASARSTETRRVAIAAWISADGNATAVLEAVRSGSITVEDVLRSISLVSSPAARQSLFDPLAKLVPTLAGSRGAAPLSRPGLQVDFFAPNPPDVSRETLAAAKPSASGTAVTVVMDQPVLKTRDGFALRFAGQLKVSQPGKYAFFLSSDDGSRFYLNGEQLIDNDGLHGMVEKRGTATLAAGLHEILVTYFDNGGGDGLGFDWSGPGIPRQPVPADVLVSAAAQTVQDLGITALMSLPGRETDKATLLAGLLKEGASLQTSLAAAAALPSEAWNATTAALAAAAATADLASREPRDRNSDAAQPALRLAQSVRSRLDAAALQQHDRKLADVVVPLITLGTVRERMIYDREMLVVQAGRPIEIRLTNTDNMPHNLAIVRPGSMAEVGELAEATGRDADAATRNFVPTSDKVLAAGKLVQPEQSDSLFFEVPKEPGIYPYVCTYPGHWRRMYGAMYVVADLPAWEADPAGSLAASGLKIQDELLRYLGRNTEWQLSDLQGDVMHLSHRANQYAIGKQLFTAASCIGCHKLAGQGQNVGPDLTKLPAEYSKTDVLDHILNPSKKIDPKYQSKIITLNSGKVVTGLVIEDTPQNLKVVDNPLAPDKAVVISRSDIEEVAASDISIMPKGVLNKLTREEIFDLLAFVLAGGDAKNPLFAEHHEHEKN
jgi:putative heme-binding domain-containing protein